MTNLEGRVLRRRRVRPPPHAVIDDLTLLALLAGRPGPRPLLSADPREVFDELRRASAGGTADYAASVISASTPKTASSGPALAKTTPGRRVFTGRFAIADRRARFVRTDHRDPAEPPGE